MKGDSECRFDLVGGVGGGGFDTFCEVRGHGDGELIIELGEGLERGDRDVSAVDEHGGVGAIEGGHPGLLLASDDEAVDGAPVDARILGVGEVVFVVRAVGGFIDDEVLKAGAFHGEIEFSGCLED